MSTWSSRCHSTMRGIVGMTDNAITPRPRTIGRLRKGTTVKGKTRNGKEFDRPVDLDHFRFTSDDPAIEAIFHETYGPEPRIINAILPYPTADENFQTCMEEWRAGGLVHRCDGEMMTVWVDADGARHISPPADPLPCPYHTGAQERTRQNPGCRPVGRLAVMIPELMEEGYTGVVVLAETSKNDLMEIRRNLLDLEERRIMEGATIKPLYYFPITLRRVEREISCPDEEHGRVRRTKWMVEIEPAAVWMKAQLKAARQALLPEEERRPRPQLQSPDWEDVTTGGRTVAEVEAELFDRLEDAPGFAVEEDEPIEGDFAEAPALVVVNGQDNGNGGRELIFATKKARDKFINWHFEHKALNLADLKAALQIDDLAAFAGTKDEALDAVAAYIEAQIAERLSTLGVDPAGGIDAALAALAGEVGPGEPGEAPEEAAPTITDDMAWSWFQELQGKVATAESDRAPSEKQVGFAASLLNSCWPNAVNQAAKDQRRHEFLALLTGQPSLNDLDFAQMRILLDALTTKGADGKSVLDDIVAGYVRQVVQAQDVADGQQELDLPL